MNAIHSSSRFNPVLWLAIGLPIAAIAASFGLLYSAIHSGGADVIADHVDATGEQQVADIGPDLRAQQLGLSAIVRIDHGVLQALPVGGSFDRTATLRLSLLHPFQAKLDLDRTLRPDRFGWSVAATPGSGHDWIVQLAPGDGRWRIRGRLPRGQLAVLLKPSFDAQ